jgi:hypothetical protein
MPSIYSIAVFAANVVCPRAKYVGLTKGTHLSKRQLFHIRQDGGKAPKLWPPCCVFKGITNEFRRLGV